MCKLFEKDYCLSCKYVLRHKVNAEKNTLKNQCTQPSGHNHNYSILI